MKNKTHTYTIVYRAEVKRVCYVEAKNEREARAKVVIEGFSE